MDCTLDPDRWPLTCSVLALVRCAYQLGRWLINIYFAFDMKEEVVFGHSASDLSKLKTSQGHW